MIFEIELHGKHGAGKVALVDAEDAELVQGYRWRLNNSGYVMATFYVRKDDTTSGYEPGKVHCVMLHRLVMQQPEGSQQEVHHRNYCKLDNRKGNLELCSREENMQWMNAWKKQRKNNRNRRAS